MDDLQKYSDLIKSLDAGNIATYAQIKEKIENLYKFLNTLDIEVAVKSHFESDYLNAINGIEKYQFSKGLVNSDERDAIGGLHELYKWIWSVKEAPEFDKLIPHLKMLSESATRINSSTNMINPVTLKQDDKTNKLIETIVAFYAVKSGTDVEIDDPITSSGGTNPDIIFSLNGKRVAFACKTLRSSSSQTILDNIRSAAKQINRAECDVGYILINTMNILPHEDISKNVYFDYKNPIEYLTNYINNIYKKMNKESAEELIEIFKSNKIRPIILSFLHSTTRINSDNQIISTMLKSTCVTELIDAKCTQEDLYIFNGINDFIHNR